MASTTADTTLVRGAFAAAGGNLKGENLQASQAMTQIGQMIAVPVSHEIQKRHKQFQAFADWELSRNPGLNDSEFTALFENLQKMKSTYMLGDNLTRASIMRQMTEMKVQQDELDATKKNYANTLKNSTTGGGNLNNKNNQNWVQSELGQQITDAMKGAPVWRNGKWGYIINDEFYDTSRINEVVEQLKFDHSAANKLGTVIIPSIIEKAQLSDPQERKDFNWDVEFNSIKNNFVNKSTVKSLAYDEIIPGQTFYSGLKNHLLKGTYGQLGITNEQAKSLDPTAGDGITDEDAEIIVSTLINDPQYESIARHYLTVYYTRYGEQQWNAIQNQKPESNLIKPIRPELQGTVLDQGENNPPMWEPPKKYWWRED